METSLSREMGDMYTEALYALATGPGALRERLQDARAIFQKREHLKRHHSPEEISEVDMDNLAVFLQETDRLDSMSADELREIAFLVVQNYHRIVIGESHLAEKKRGVELGPDIEDDRPPEPIPATDAFKRASALGEDCRAFADRMTDDAAPSTAKHADKPKSEGPEPKKPRKKKGEEK